VAVAVGVLCCVVLCCVVLCCVVLCCIVLQICGLESRAARSMSSANAVVLRHIRRLRRFPKFASALFVLQIESNLAFESDRIYTEILRQIPEERNSLCALRETDDRIGGRTGESSKAAMAMLLLDRISNGGVFFMNPILTTEDDGMQMKSVLLDQLGSYSRKPSLNGRRYQYTGKVDGKQDDICIAFQMVLYYRNLFMRDTSRYGHLHKWTV
jgi:hypothetical protein